MSVATNRVAAVLRHDGGPLAPHDAIWAWHLDPLTVGLVVCVAVLYRRGWRRSTDGTAKAFAFGAGLTVAVLAVSSPIDAVAEILLSAHMVQHVLLVAVAGPLLASSASGATLLRGLPTSARRGFVATRRGVGIGVSAVQRLRSPVGRWLLFVLTFWTWHASALYGLTVDNAMLHVLEHAMFLITAMLFWSMVLGPRRVRLEPGLSVLAIFGLGFQGVFLAVLTTFSREPWYEPYEQQAPGWGIDPLSDQHLAGVIMWIPTSLVYTAIALTVATRWIRRLDEPVHLDTAPAGTVT